MNREVSEEVRSIRGASQKEIWEMLLLMEKGIRPCGRNKQGDQGSWCKVSKGSVVRGEDHLGS